MKIVPDTRFALRKRQSLPEELAAVLSRRIQSGEFMPGDVLPSEQVLADTFEVSRTVVREALARLKYEGLIQSKRGSGPIVCEAGPARGFSLNIEAEESLTQAERHRFFEFRMIMEGEAAALAALRRTPEQLQTLGGYIDQMQRSIRGESTKESGIEPDYLFHCLVAESVGNEYLGEFTKYLSSKIWLGVYRARWMSNLVKATAEAVLEEHRAIYEGIREGDPHRARAAAQQHMMNSAARQKVILDKRFLTGTFSS